MTELDLSKFISTNGIETRWDGDQLSAYILHNELFEFAQMIESLVSDGGIETTLLSRGYVWVDLVPICDFYGINPGKIKEKY